jgi:hypothetical protein
MSQLPVLRSDEKLPRGSYFYIQVGHRFYAGEVAETIEVEVSNEEPFLGFFNKDGSKKPGYNARLYRDGYFSNSWRRGNRSARDHRKGTVPTYMKPRPRPEKTIKNELTGRKSPKLVDELKLAKQFRRRDRVDSACERLRTCYEGLDVKVSVGYVKGESL